MLYLVVCRYDDVATMLKVIIDEIKWNEMKWNVRESTINKKFQIAMIAANLNQNCDKQQKHRRGSFIMNKFTFSGKSCSWSSSFRNRRRSKRILQKILWSKNRNGRVFEISCWIVLFFVCFFYSITLYSSLDFFSVAR